MTSPCTSNDPPVSKCTFDKRKDAVATGSWQDIDSIVETYLNPTDKKRKFFELWPSKPVFLRQPPSYAASVPSIASGDISDNPVYISPAPSAYSVSEAYECHLYRTNANDSSNSECSDLNDKSLEGLARVEASMQTFNLTKEGVQCGHCRANIFTTMEAFKIHHQVEHTEKQVYQCRFCLSEEIWPSIQDFKSHIIYHCNSTFADSSNLYREDYVEGC